MKKLLLFLALCSSLFAGGRNGVLIINNTTDDWTVVKIQDIATNAVLYTGSGTVFNNGVTTFISGFYRDAILRLGTGSNAFECPVYLDDNSFVNVTGTLASGNYVVTEYEAGNYEQMFFTGFAATSLLCLSVFMMRLIRRAMVP